jgi:hypothetical protein
MWFRNTARRIAELMGRWAIGLRRWRPRTRLWTRGETCEVFNIMSLLVSLGAVLTVTRAWNSPLSFSARFAFRNSSLPRIYVYLEATVENRFPLTVVFNRELWIWRWSIMQFNQLCSLLLGRNESIPIGMLHSGTFCKTVFSQRLVKL